MSYTPLNVFVYASAQAGAMSGMQMPGSAVLFKATSPDYAILSATAGAFAQEFDTQWGASPVPNIYDAQVISDACAHLWASRTTLPQTDIFGHVLVVFDSPATYTKEVAALIAMIQAGDAFNASQGTTLPAAGASGTSALTTFVTSLPATIATAAQEAIFVSGYSTPYDGGQGYFVWDPVATYTPNGGTIIQVTGVATGRWMRVYDQNIWVTWFGAKGDGVTDDSAAIQAAINAAGTGGIVYFPRLPQYNGIGLFQSYLVENTLTVLSSQNQNGITFRGDSPAGSSGGFYQVRILFDLTTHTGTTGSITARTTIGGLANNLTLSNIAIPSDVQVGDCLTISGATSVDGNGQLINNGNFTITSVTSGVGTSGAVTYYGYNPQVNFGPITSGTVPDTNNGGITWIIRKNGFLNLAEYTRFENITLQSIGSSVGSLFYSTINTTPVDGNTQCSFEFCEFVGGVFGVNIGDIALDFPTTPYPVDNCEFYLFNKCDFQSQLYAGVKNNGGEQKNQKLTTCSFQFQPVGLWFWSGSLSCYDVIFEANTVTNIQLVNGVDTTYICGVQAELSARLFVSSTGYKGGGSSTSYQCILENCRADTDPAHMSPDGYLVQWIYNGGLEMSNCEFSLGEGGFGSGATPLTVSLSGFGNPGVANNTKSLVVMTNCGFPNGPADPIVTGTNALFGQWESRGNYCNNGQGVDYAIPDGVNYFNIPIQSITTNGGGHFTGTFTATTGSNTIVSTVNQSEFSGNANPVFPGMFLTFVTVGAGSFLVETVSNTTPCNIVISTILYPTGYPAGFPGSGSPGLCAAIIGVLPVPQQQLQFVTPVDNIAPAVVSTNVVDLPNNGFTNVELNNTNGTGFNLCGMIWLGVVDQVRILTNLTGGSFTLKHESTTETTPWNRFHNPAGTDATVTMSATVRWSNSLQRWVIQSFQ